MLKVQYNSTFLRKDSAEVRFGEKADVLAGIGMVCFFCEDEWLYQMMDMDPLAANETTSSLVKAGFVLGQDFCCSSAMYSKPNAHWLQAESLMVQRAGQQASRMEVVRYMADPGLVLGLPGQPGDFLGLSAWREGSAGGGRDPVMIQAVPEPWMD